MCLMVCLFTQIARQPQPTISLTLVLSAHALRSPKLPKCPSCTPGQLTADGANKVARCLPGTQLCHTHTGQAHPDPLAPPATGEVLAPSWALEGLAILSTHKVSYSSKTGMGARNTPRTHRYANKMPSPQNPKVKHEFFPDFH